MVRVRGGSDDTRLESHGKVLRETGNPGESIESHIKGQDSVDAVLLHHRQMHGLARGEALVAKDDLLGALDSSSVNWKDFIHYIQKRVEGRLDVVAPIDGDVAVQDLLQYFRVGDQALALADQPFQQPLRVGLVGTGCAHQIHRNIGVNQNHCC